MTNSIIIRRQLGVSLVAEIKKQACQAQRSSPTRKKLRFCPNWRPPSSSQGYPKIPIIHDIAFMKCGFPHIYGHLQEDYVLETFDKKFGLRNPPPLPLYRQKQNFRNPKIDWTAPLRSHSGSMHAIIIWWQIIADLRCFYAFYMYLIFCSWICLWQLSHDAAWFCFWLSKGRRKKTDILQSPPPPLTISLAVKREPSGLPTSELATSSQSWGWQFWVCPLLRIANPNYTQEFWL